MKIRGGTVLLAAVLLIWAQCGEAKAKGKARKLEHPSTVKLSQQGPGGHYYIQDKEEDYWRIIPSNEDEDHSFFFFNEKTQKSQWNDPRLPEDHGKTVMEIMEGKMLKKKSFYTLNDDLTYETRTEILSEQKMDTNKFYEKIKKGSSLTLEDLNVEEPASTVTKSMVVMIPLMLFLGCLAARIWYLHTYHPELLFPTKERKQRLAKREKMAKTKARGKMSQDGKGGRSANS